MLWEQEKPHGAREHKQKSRPPRQPRMIVFKQELLGFTAAKTNLQGRYAKNIDYHLEA